MTPTDTARCEPPEELRGVDGWHVLTSPSPYGYERPWFWVPSSDGGQAHWNNLGCPAQAFHDGYRYIAPVTPPAVVAALVEALEELVMACDLPGDHCEVEQAMPRARAALALYRGRP